MKGGIEQDEWGGMHVDYCTDVNWGSYREVGTWMNTTKNGEYVGTRLHRCENDDANGSEWDGRNACVAIGRADMAPASEISVHLSTANRIHSALLLHFTSPSRFHCHRHFCLLLISKSC